jgi:hypothetical protein
MLLEVTKKQLKKLSEDKDVESVDIFVNEEKVQETTNSIPATTIDYIKGQGLNGSGVNVGILEYTTDSHAETVRNIVEDIAPGANITMKYGHNKAEDYAKIDELVSEGVNIINYSAGYKSEAGTYAEFDEYIDYIISNFDITFVKSAGNSSASNSNVTSPGMAYNGITVGSINEQDTASWTDDVMSSFSCFGENSGLASKPDVSAPGEGIYGSKNGTSYAAPHTTGLVALMMQQNPTLKAYPAAVKSILASSTTHRTASDYGNNLWSPMYSDKEGAGVIDGKGVHRLINDNNIKNKPDLSKSQFTYNDTFYVYELNKFVRVALSWVKKDSLSDMDLKIYDSRNQLIAYSLSSSNNTELVEFKPRYLRGTYKIVVEGYSILNNTEDICLSWQQRE